MRTQRLGAGAFVLFGALCAAAQSVMPAKEPLGATLGSEAVEVVPGTASQAGLDALDATVVNVTQGMPLHKALAGIASATKLNVIVDWETIENGGTMRSRAVDFGASGVSARTALRLILTHGGGSGRSGLAFVVDSNQVIVSTLEDLRSRYEILRAYDVSFAFTDSETGVTDAQCRFREMIQRAVEPETWAENGGTARMTFAGDRLIVRQSYDVMPRVDAMIELLRQEIGARTVTYDVRDLLKGEPPADPHLTGKVDELMSVIETSCGRDTWRNRGGRTSSIAHFDGRLVVTTTFAVHRQIEELLVELRKQN